MQVYLIFMLVEMLRIRNHLNMIALEEYAVITPQE